MIILFIRHMTPQNSDKCLRWKKSRMGVYPARDCHRGEAGSRSIDSLSQDESSLIDYWNNESQFLWREEPIATHTMPRKPRQLLIRLHALSFCCRGRSREWTRDGRLNRSRHGPVSIDPAAGAGIAAAPDTPDR